MDSKELRSFAEAYKAVHAPQEVDEAVYGGDPKKEAPKDDRMVVTNADKKANTKAYQNFKAGVKGYKAADHMGEEVVEEGLRSAVKRLLGGGKKEAEAPKPESRGEQLRKKYNVGPEKSDTSAKRQILDRSRAKAEKDEKDYGDKPFQKQVAQKSKAAHDRYLKAGYSKYGADDARGRGSKATKRAAALNREEFEYIVNALVEEGYDLSSYTWDEMYDICLDEAVYGGEPKKKEDKRMIVTNADKKGNTPAYQKYKAGDKRYKSADHLGEGVRDLDSEKGTAERKARLEKKRGMKLDDHPEYKKEKSVDEAKQNARGKQRGVLTPNKKKSLNMEMEYDLFDTILEYLIAEGYADTNEAALVIMGNMSEEWIEDIVEIAAEQSDKQIDRGVKTTYKAQNVLDNQHQGRSKGLNKLPRGKREEKAERMRGRLKTRRDDLFGERNKREDESRAELKKKYGL